MKALITGGSRSGKSRYALELAESLSDSRIFLATAQAYDTEMDDRIRMHRLERGAGWETIEEPLNIVPILERPELILVDCLTLWVSNLLLAHGEEADLTPSFDALIQAVRARTGDLLFVTNEVGMGLVPETPLGRRFRDWSGWLSQHLAMEVDQVTLMVAGLPLRLK